MPKQKTHKGIRKRTRLTASGKAKKRQAGMGHLLSHKSGNKRRRLRRANLISASDQRKVERLYGLR